jgi:hypothetical protein
MTQTEKLQVINERIKEKQLEFDAAHISAMVIAGYLDDLHNKGYLCSPFVINPTGYAIKSICEELDWRPSDEDIIAIVTEIIEPHERVAFAAIIKQYRDNREILLKELAEYSQALRGDSTTS